MTVIMEQRELPVVACSISNRFGAAYENSSIKGIAHVIEHLLFTGTATRSYEDISREIEKKGGILNAFTTHEVTSYWFKLPSEHFFVGMDILTDMLLHPRFDPDKFEKEKKVILEEIKMYHDDPAKYVYDKILEHLYKKPFGEGIIGSQATVSGLKRDFVQKYFKQWYSPEQYVVTLVGKAPFEKLCAYLEKMFPKGTHRPISLKIAKSHAESTEERLGIDQAHFIFAAHSPLLTDPNYYAFEVLDAYLANGMSSRLFLKIREEKGLAYSVQSSINCEKHYSYYTIYVGTRKEAIGEVKHLILQEINSLLETMGEKELAESKERLIGLQKISSEESSKVMTELLFSELADKAESYYEHEKNINKVTLTQVKQLAKQLSKSYSSVAVVPANSEQR